MNIDQYRAMKAQLEAEQENSTTKEQSNVQADKGTTKSSQSTSQTQEQGKQVQSNEGAEDQTQTPSSETKSEKLVIDGKEVSLDEIKEWQQGYLRQSDYTKKTQELSSQKRQLEEAQKILEQVEKDPELAKQLNFDPRESQIRDLESKYYELLLDKEINDLKGKYTDFNEQEVLTLAHERNLNSLEDAYLLNKSLKPQQTSQESKQEATVDVEAIKAQIRAELEAELGTKTIISSQNSSAPTGDDSPQLSPAEQKVARAMGMSAKEYAVWRNPKKK